MLLLVTSTDPDCAVVMAWAGRYWVRILGTVSNPERIFKGPMGRYKATSPSSLPLHPLLSH